MLKLKDKDTQPAMAGLPPSYREWWDLGDGYEIFIDIGKTCCILLIDAPGTKDITFDIAKYFGLDTKKEDIKFGEQPNGRELYLSLGIDCVVLKYTKPENYMDLLKKIEVIVNEHFKTK